jgi:hypothetical protein
VDAWHVFCNRRAEPQMLSADRLAGDALAAAGLQVHSFNGLLLHEPWEVQVDMSRCVGKAHAGACCLGQSQLAASLLLEQTLSACIVGLPAVWRMRCALGVQYHGSLHSAMHTITARLCMITRGVVILVSRSTPCYAAPC